MAEVLLDRMDQIWGTRAFVGLLKSPELRKVRGIFHFWSAESGPVRAGFLRENGRPRYIESLFGDISPVS